MGRRKKQGCEYSKLNPNATEFVPAVVSTCEGKYSADEHASYKLRRGQIPKSSRPAPYLNNNIEKLSFAFLGLESDSEEEEIENLRVDFVSELPGLVVKKIFQHLDVTNIQNCRRVSHNWNEVIIELQPNVIKDIESDAAFIRRLIASRLSGDLPEEPFYQDRKCATCHIGKHYNNNMYAIKHDIVRLITYYYDCEDKSKKHDCPHCPDWYEVKVGDYGDEVWDSEEEDYIWPAPAPPKSASQLKRHFRTLWSHFSHLVCRHDKEVYQFLLKEQKLIPLPKSCRGEDNRDEHQTGCIDKIIEDLIFRGDSEAFLLR